MFRVLTSVFFLLIFASFSAWAGDSRQGLSRGELQQLFAGNTAIGTHVSKKLQVKDYYGKKGKFVSSRSNGEKLKGKWWISHKRAAVCVKYKHKPDKAFCRVVVKSQQGGYDKIRDKDGAVMVHYDKFVPGKLTK